MPLLGAVNYFLSPRLLDCLYSKKKYSVSSSVSSSWVANLWLWQTWHWHFVIALLTKYPARYLGTFDLINFMYASGNARMSAMHFNGATDWYNLIIMPQRLIHEMMSRFIIAVIGVWRITLVLNINLWELTNIQKEARICWFTIRIPLELLQLLNCYLPVLKTEFAGIQNCLCAALSLWSLKPPLNCASTVKLELQKQLNNQSKLSTKAAVAIAPTLLFHPRKQFPQQLNDSWPGLQEVHSCSTVLTNPCAL